MKQKYNGALLVLFTMFLFISCSDNNNTDDYKGFSIALDQPNNAISGKGGPFSLQINTIGTWTVTVKESWCKFSKTEGTGSTSIVGVAAINNGEARTATILVTSNGETQSIIFTQTKRDGNTTDPDPEDPDPENPDPEDPDPEDPDPTPTPEGYASRIEIPKLKGGALNIFHTFVADNQNGKKVITYSYEYDCTKKHTRWVAFTFDNLTCQANVKRSDAWNSDPNIPLQYRTSKGDYNPDYTRGHLVASSDRVYSTAANKQTFYYSNMSPQQSTGFNSGGGIWNNMEDKLQAWSKITNASDTLYVVKGGTIDKDSDIREWTSTGVAVPKYYFMTVLSYKNKQYKGMAFYVEHKANKSKDLKQYAMSIDELEAKTGIDFFHNLDKATEAAVEANYQASDWSW